jgi:hypothetical protein
MMQKAWSKNRRAYLMAHGMGGQMASISAIDSEYKSYSLYFEKTGNDFNGPCSSDYSIQELTPLLRLQKCYLNENLYWPYDSLASNTLDLVQTMIWYYAYNLESLQEAVRNNYLTDYSRAIRSERAENRILLEALWAHGLEGNLIGPFDGTTFWKKTGKANYKSMRLYQAAKALAEKDLVFVDTNIRCKDFRGPLVLEKEKYLSAIAQRCVYHRMGFDLETDLYKSMIAKGFYYDDSKQTWILDSKEGGK